MAGIKKFQKEGVTIFDRTNILKAKFDALTRDERGDIKRGMRDAMRAFSEKALFLLRLHTPDRRESSEIYSKRVLVYNKKGEPDWLVKRSDSPSERQHGITVRDGWIPPRLDFSGSAVNRIQLNIRFANSSPAAPLVFLGAAGKGSWDINTRDMGDKTRKVMFWEGADGKPRFVWAKNGPIRFVKPRPLTRVLEEAEVQLSDSKVLLINQLQEAIRRDFDNLI